MFTVFTFTSLTWIVADCCSPGRFLLNCKINVFLFLLVVSTYGDSKMYLTSFPQFAILLVDKSVP